MPVPRNLPFFFSTLPRDGDVPPDSGADESLEGLRFYRGKNQCVNNGLSYESRGGCVFFVLCAFTKSKTLSTF